MRNVTNETRLKEGRGTGYGPDYVPFITVNDDSSHGTGALIYDPIAKRMVSVMSRSERNFFWHLRWDDTVRYIYEQCLLDHETVNDARRNLGMRAVPEKCCYTCDFLVEYKNGKYKAYSVKFNHEVFNPDSLSYTGHPKKFERMKQRQDVEAEYWRLKDIPFTIVTTDDFNQEEAEVIGFVLGFYGTRGIVTPEQKLMHLIAHKVYRVPMDREHMHPHRLLETFPYDIDRVYENFRKEEGEE